MEDNNKIRVGITHGDINGVGYEVILKTFLLFMALQRLRLIIVKQWIFRQTLASSTRLMMLCRID